MTIVILGDRAMLTRSQRTKKIWWAVFNGPNWHTQWQKYRDNRGSILPSLHKKFSSQHFRGHDGRTPVKHRISASCDYILPRHPSKSDNLVLSFSPFRPRPLRVYKIYVWHKDSQASSLPSSDRALKPVHLMALENPWSADPVKVTVGREEQELFLVHGHILKKSPFFQGCLRNDCKESSSMSVDLPEDEPEVFLPVVNYLFSGDTSSIVVDQPKSLICTDTECQSLELLVRTYVAADKFLLPELQNLLMRKLYHHHIVRTPHPPLISILRPLKDSPMRKFLILAYVWSISNHPFDTLCERNSSFQTYNADAGVDHVDIMKVVSGNVENPAHFPVENYLVDGGASDGDEGSKTSDAAQRTADGFSTLNNYSFTCMRP